MKKLYLQIILISFISLQVAFSQSNTLASDQHPEHRYYPLKGVVFYKDYRQVQGNAYLTDDWAIGDIFLTSGDELMQVKYKFDTYAHKLLVYNEYLKRIVIVECEKVARFTQEEDGTKKQFVRKKSDKSFRLGYKEIFLQELEVGQVSLYKLYYQDIIPLRTPVMPYIDEFVPDENYYLYRNNKYSNVRLRKRVLINEFPEFKTEIKQYARKNKIRARNQNDFASLVSYVNELLKDK